MRLDFSFEEVKKHFNFLVTVYGFQVSHIKQVGSLSFIKFESREVYVCLSYGPPAFEVEISFGRIGIDDLPGAYSFALGDLILLGHCPTWIWDSNQPDLAEYARFLHECGSDCLRGDPFIFAQMKRNRETLVQNCQQDETITNVRQEARDAWIQKDYLRVVNLYESISTVLTPSEAMKLDYARKHLVP